MTRNEFMRRLEAGLSGMPQSEIDDVMSDYAAHFDAAIEDGRSEAEVAEALGDPGRLARELKLEAGIRKWKDVRTPSSAWAAIIAFIGLGAIDILVLIPILFPALAVIFGLYVALFAIFIAGAVVTIVGPFSPFPGGFAAAILVGLGLMAVAIALGAILTIVTIGLINALLWFGRLHYRIIEPALPNEYSERFEK